MSRKPYRTLTITAACVAALSPMAPSAVGFEHDPTKPQSTSPSEAGPLNNSAGALGLVALSTSGREERCREATVRESVAPWLKRDFIYLNVVPKRKSARRILVGVEGVAPKIQPECQFLFSDFTVTYDVTALNRSSKIVSSGSIRRRSNNTLAYPFRKVVPVAAGRFCVRQQVTAQSWSGGITPFGEWAATIRIGRDLRVHELADDISCAYN